MWIEWRETYRPGFAPKRIFTARFAIRTRLVWIHLGDTGEGRPPGLASRSTVLLQGISRFTGASGLPSGFRSVTLPPLPMKPTLPLAVAISVCLLTTSVAGHAGESPISTAASGPSTAAAAQKPPRLLMRRVWEPNERAFSVLLPEGWKLTGGIFNVNPLQMNGPGNTVSPKLDLTIRQDEAGTVMLHWLPAWNLSLIHI